MRDARLVVGKTTIDLDEGVVSHDGERVALTPPEQRLLRVLHAAAGRVLTRAELAAAVAPPRRVRAASVNTIVHRVRLKLGDAATRLVTVLGEGYRLEPDPPGGREPPLASELVGRDDELAALSGDAPVLWVVGQGGVGKSSLLRAYAARAIAWSASVLWIDPSGGDASGSPHTTWLALAEGLGLEGRAAESLEQLRHRLAHALERRTSTLVVIDPAERLAGDLEPWLERLALARGTRVLVGSRTPPTRAPCLVVAPLAPAAARRLFELRLGQARLGRALRSDEAPIARALVDLIGGLPLALELAAVRAATTSMEALRASLTDPIGALAIDRGPWEPHQRSLLRVLDETFELLEPGPRDGLLCLALAPGEPSRADALRLVGGADTLERLRRASWIGDAPGAAARTRMHDLTRLFLKRRLDAHEGRARIVERFVARVAEVVIPWLDPRRDYRPDDAWGPLLRDRDLVDAAAVLATRPTARLALHVARGVLALRHGPREAVAQVLDAMPFDDGPPELVATLELQRAALADLLARSDEADRALARGIEAAERARLGKRRAREQGALLLVRLLTFRAQRAREAPAIARDALERALVVARDQPDEEVVTFVEVRFAAHLNAVERWEEALARLDERRARLTERTSLLVRLHVAAHRMFALAELGAVTPGLAAVDELTHVMSVAGHAFDDGWVHLHRGLLLAERDVPAARAQLEAARARLGEAGRERDAASVELILAVLDAIDGLDGRDATRAIEAALPRLDLRPAAWAEALLGRLTRTPSWFDAARARLSASPAPCTRAAVELLAGDETSASCGHRARLSRRLLAALAARTEGPDHA